MQSNKYSSEPLDAYLVRTDDAHQVSCDGIPSSSRYAMLWMRLYQGDPPSLSTPSLSTPLTVIIPFLPKLVALKEYHESLPPNHVE